MTERAVLRPTDSSDTLTRVPDQVLDPEDRTLLFEVLFDLRALLARLVALVEGGDENGEEEEEGDPDVP